MAAHSTAKIPAVKIGVLGAITISAYGAWYYIFGVLLDPIIADTGWGEAVLTSAFSASVLLGGVASVAGGWLLDRFGSRFVFGLAGVICAVAFQVAAATSSVAMFAASSALGGGALAALGFYHVTQTAAVRLSPGATDKAIAVLTIWGAFSSAIFIPLAAWLVSSVGWRPTLRIITLIAAATFLAGVVAVDTRTKEAPTRTSRIFSELMVALREPASFRFLAAQGLAGVGVSTILVYQVPAMTAAGLTLAAASFWAGFRGFAQIGGRLPLMPIVRRLGTVGSLRVAYAAIAVGSLSLAFASNQLVALSYALLAGFGIGATSPLVGMHARLVYGESSLGTAMGVLSLVFMVVGALGPAGAGWLSATTGSRALPVLLSALVVLAAVPVIRTPARQPSVRPPLP